MSYYIKKRKSLIGQTFNYLTVLEKDDKANYRRNLLCLCKCGNKIYTQGSKLKTGHTKSCGCLRRQMAAQKSKDNANPLIMANISEYRSWRDAKHRCYNIKDKERKNYGGRGIIMCDRWKNSFDLFLSDMGNKPTPKHTLERKDVNGNYEPSNCKWIPKSEQGANMRKNVFIEYNNDSFHIAEWARRLGIRQPKLFYHYKKYGGTVAIEKFFKQKV